MALCLKSSPRLHLYGRLLVGLLGIEQR
jgi:hypothetical protein